MFTVGINYAIPEINLLPDVSFWRMRQSHLSQNKISLNSLKTMMQMWRSTDKWRSSQCEAVQPSGSVVGAESKRAKEEILGNTSRLYTSICACLVTFAQQSIGQGTIDNTT